LLALLWLGGLTAAPRCASVMYEPRSTSERVAGFELWNASNDIGLQRPESKTLVLYEKRAELSSLEPPDSDKARRPMADSCVKRASARNSASRILFNFSSCFWSDSSRLGSSDVECTAASNDTEAETFCGCVSDCDCVLARFFMATIDARSRLYCSSISRLRANICSRRRIMSSSFSSLPIVSRIWSNVAVSSGASVCSGESGCSARDTGDDRPSCGTLSQPVASLRVLGGVDGGDVTCSATHASGACRGASASCEMCTSGNVVLSTRGSSTA
jgi:hypothetical protein